MPILFGYKYDGKFSNTIFRVDSETLQVNQFKDDQINLKDCNIVQVQDSLYAVNKDESFMQYRLGR